MGQPHIGRRSFTVIGFSIHVDASVFPQLIDLLEGRIIAFRIDGKGRAAEFIDD